MGEHESSRAVLQRLAFGSIFGASTDQWQSWETLVRDLQRRFPHHAWCVNRNSRQSWESSKLTEASSNLSCLFISDEWDQPLG